MPRLGFGALLSRTEDKLKWGWRRLRGARRDLLYGATVVASWVSIYSQALQGRIASIDLMERGLLVVADGPG